MKFPESKTDQTFMLTALYFNAPPSLTKHVLQTDDARQVIIKIDVKVLVREPQTQQLQDLIVQLHPWMKKTHTKSKSGGFKMEMFREKQWKNVFFKKKKYK